MRCVTRVLRRRGPYNAPLFNLPILLEQKMGGLKIIGFFETESTFCAHWATWRAEVRKPKKTFMMSRRLWVFLGSMSFQWWHNCAFGFPRGCPPINSILCLLLHFSYCVFLRVLLLLPSVLSFAFLSEALELFCQWFSCRNGDCIAVFNISSSDFHLVRAFCSCFSLCCALLFVGFVSDLFGQAVCDCLCGMLVFVGFLGFF